MEVLTGPVLSAMDKFITNGHTRSIALRMVHKKIHKASLGSRGDNCPAAIKEDKYYMLRNLVNSIDRGLTSGTISPAVRRGLLGSLLKNVLLGRGREKIESFKQKYGCQPPGFITISPTKFCNLKCRGCYAGSSSSYNEKLPFDIFDRIIREKTEFWGSYFTVISGGEPFLYRDAGRGLTDIAQIHQDNFFLVYTNGTLIDEKLAARLNEVGNVTPAISVEGFEKDTDARRGQGTFQKILKAFQNLRGQGVPFGISITATGENAETVVSDEFIDFYLGEQGALYAWFFQYMPIGRSYGLDLMVKPEQRVYMFRRTQKLIREKGLFMADFWNSGTASYGCISAGRESGYLYINWKGNVTPCVFNPYSVDNINDVYKRGGTLNDVLFTPFFKAIRNWQKEYFLDRSRGEVGNLIRPCPIKDHYRDMRKFIDEYKASPIDNEAEESLKDDEYYRGLVAYGDRLGELTQEIWEREYLNH